MKFLLSAIFFVFSSAVFAQINYIHVSPAGDDKNTGKSDSPVKSVAKAVELSQSYGRTKVSILLQQGTYYLSAPVEITNTENSPAELEITAANRQKVVISAGRVLSTDWSHFKGNIYRTSVPEGISFERFFVNGILQTLARYPNLDKRAKVFRGTAEDATFYVRVLTWGNPVGGYVHALDEKKRGSLHYRITGVDDTDNLELDGGWQIRKPVHMAEKERFVENILGELDAPGEWYLDKTLGVLYYYPSSGTDLSKAKFEVSNLKSSFILKGKDSDRLKNVKIKNLNFAHNERLFMDSRDTLTSSDFSVFRGGAVLFENTLNCSVEACSFSDLGGNAVVLNNFNENGSLAGCYISNIGANGAMILGDCNNCLIADNLFSNIGVIEKQGVAILLNAVKKINIEQNTFFEMPGPPIRAENCDLKNIQIRLNNHFNDYQELRAAPGEQSYQFQNGPDNPKSGVQNSALKALLFNRNNK